MSDDSVCDTDGGTRAATASSTIPQGHESVHPIAHDLRLVPSILIFFDLPPSSLFQAQKPSRAEKDSCTHSCECHSGRTPHSYDKTTHSFSQPELFPTQPAPNPTLAVSWCCGPLACSSASTSCSFLLASAASAMAASTSAPLASSSSCGVSAASLPWSCAASEAACAASRACANTQCWIGNQANRFGEAAKTAAMLDPYR